MVAKHKAIVERPDSVLFPKKDKGTNLLDRIILRLVGAEDAWLARSDHPQEKQLLDMLVGLSKKMHLEQPPPLFIYKSDAPNAASMMNGKIAVSTNLMQIMTPEQMEAVLAHELSHYRHRGRDWSVRLGITGTLVALITAITRSGKHPSTRPKSFFEESMVFRWFTSETGKISPAKVLEDAGVIVGASLLRRKYKRTIEAEADREAATITEPREMIGALQNLEARLIEIRDEKLRQQLTELSLPGSGNHVVPPGEGWMKRVSTSLGKLFRDYPSFEDRVQRLKALEGEQSQISNNSVIR
jgi:heat shock protein HtpX